jgi:hypothetical protein
MKLQTLKELFIHYLNNNGWTIPNELSHLFTKTGSKLEIKVETEHIALYDSNNFIASIELQDIFSDDPSQTWNLVELLIEGEEL